MCEAAPQAVVFTATDESALAKLRYGWGDAYRIGWDARRGWWASRRDGQGEDIAAAGPDELWAAIFANYRSSPVARDSSAPVTDAGAGHAAAGAAW